MITILFANGSYWFSNQTVVRGYPVHGDSLTLVSGVSSDAQSGNVVIATTSGNISGDVALSSGGSNRSVQVRLVNLWVPLLLLVTGGIGI